MKNKGRYQYRFKENPLERKFAEMWERENTNHVGMLTGGGYLDYLLAENTNTPMGEVTERDREVAATVIQWLGSLVGQSFIREASKEKEMI